MITIFCPGGNATGGTELLHQLGYKLNLFGFEAFMYYYGADDPGSATHAHFLKYHVPVLNAVSDSNDNIFIYPEIMVTSLEDIKKQLPLSKHVLWWLSVDNAHMTSELEKEISSDEDLLHFVQSYYAYDYVDNTLSVPKERLFYLSDYLNLNFLNAESDKKRDNIVLFNPRKGFERTSSLIKNSDYRIKWQALSGLAPDEIPHILQTAKVYIDFGEHPGKDRFPREAVSCGCRLVTGKRGAAANDRDVPIPEQLKIDDDLEDERILDLICSIIDNYDKTEELYRDYKTVISEEFHKFEADTLDVFSKITGNAPDEFRMSDSELKTTICSAVTDGDSKTALRLLTIYRLKKYPFDSDMIILEGYTRLGIGEEQAALYLMRSLLDSDKKNYEALLIKARALEALGMDGVEEALELAVEYSTETPDEEYVKSVAKKLMEN